MNLYQKTAESHHGCICSSNGSSLRLPLPRAGARRYLPFDHLLRKELVDEFRIVRLRSVVSVMDSTEALTENSP